MDVREGFFHDARIKKEKEKVEKRITRSRGRRKRR